MNELIKQACEQNPEFYNKLHYWVHERKKTPQTWWLIKQLCLVFGDKYITSVMATELGQKRDENGEISEGPHGSTQGHQEQEKDT